MYGQFYIFSRTAIVRVLVKICQDCNTTIFIFFQFLLIKLVLIFIDNDCSICWYLPSSLLARSFEAESVFETILHRRGV